ncbi:MAG TPA: hypothetical protein VEU08_23035 [Vicinamibacterales bacterium]|nr:hypothetical protein [Vicinamibacterales bacterium]
MDNQPVSPTRGERASELPYVIVADASADRTAACLDAVRPYRVGALVVNDASEAIRLLDQFGPPRLLIADLGLSDRQGFAVIDALGRIDGDRVRIVAWSPSREIREFAMSRLSGRRDVRILSGSVAPDVIRAAIARALDGAAPAADEIAEPDPGDGDAAAAAMDQLSRRARELCNVPGSAVFMRAPGEVRLRSVTAWTSATARPPIVDAMPAVLDEVLRSGRPVSSREGNAADGDLFAVPIVGADGSIRGSVMVFDARPLGLTVQTQSALQTLAAAEDAAQTRNVTADDRQAAGAIRAVLLDRQAGNVAIERELARVRRQGLMLSVILLEVDLSAEFRSASFEPVSIIVDTFVQAIRGSDLAIQWTHSSILVVLSGYGAAQSRPIAERVRAVLQTAGRGSVSVSGGVVEQRPGEPFEGTVNRAAEKMRLSRDSGRNRIG